MSPRRVVITAGAGGIGRVTAEAFAAHGDLVHICDVDAEALEAAVASHPGISGSICDLANRAAIERFVPAAAERLGGIDVLINNAGVSGPTAPVEAMDPDAWEAVLAVNLTGTFNVTRLAIPHLKRSEHGVILILSSVGGRFGYPERSPYSVSKRGLLAFAETLALELGDDGIRVNAIAPGGVDGERIQRVLQARAAASGRSLAEETADALANQTLKHFVDPADIAALSLFLASEHGRSITGQTIPIDGGSKTAK